MAVNNRNREGGMTIFIETDLEGISGVRTVRKAAEQIQSCGDLPI